MITIVLKIGDKELGRVELPPQGDVLSMIEKHTVELHVDGEVLAKCVSSDLARLARHVGQP